jgi:hypothetical protein
MRKRLTQGVSWTPLLACGACGARLYAGRGRSFHDPVAARAAPHVVAHFNPSR